MMYCMKCFLICSAEKLLLAYKSKSDKIYCQPLFFFTQKSCDTQLYNSFVKFDLTPFKCTRKTFFIWDAKSKNMTSIDIDFFFPRKSYDIQLLNQNLSHWLTHWHALVSYPKSYMTQTLKSFTAWNFSKKNLDLHLSHKLYLHNPLHVRN
jgi:hypothetical protein